MNYLKRFRGLFKCCSLISFMRWILWFFEVLFLTNYISLFLMMISPLFSTVQVLYLKPIYETWNVIEVISTFFIIIFIFHKKYVISQVNTEISSGSYMSMKCSPIELMLGITMDHSNRPKCNGGGKSMNLTPICCFSHSVLYCNFCSKMHFCNFVTKHHEHPKCTYNI